MVVVEDEEPLDTASRTSCCPYAKTSTGFEKPRAVSTHANACDVSLTVTGSGLQL